LAVCQRCRISLVVEKRRGATRFSLMVAPLKDKTKEE